LANVDSDADDDQIDESNNTNPDILEAPQVSLEGGEMTTVDENDEIMDRRPLRDSETLQKQLDLMDSLQEENFRLKETVREGKTIISNTTNALSILEQKLSDKESALERAENLLNGSNLSKYSLDELVEMENKLRHAVDMISKQKETILETKLSEQEEKNVCVICQTEPKTVLLLPCRHFCTCKECSERAELTSCPLCRTSILEKLDVFA
jgi:hypothetical protein